MWLHWQLTWLSLRKTTSQPRADQPPVPLTLREGGRVRRQEGWGAQGPELSAQSLGGRAVQAYRIEWFQKTQMGFVRSSVSSSWNCTVTGLSKARGRSSSSSWTLMLTTGVLMTGRLGTLARGRWAHSHHGSRVTGGRPNHSEMPPTPGPSLCLTHPTCLPPTRLPSRSPQAALVWVVVMGQ